jgi:DNA replication and repair protein RecF
LSALAIRRLTLSHFRSYKLARLETDGRPVAIFGPNGAGKTNILEAISMFSPGRGLRRAQIDEMARAPEALGWKVTAELQSLGQLHEVETAWTGSGSRTILIDGKTAPQIALGRLARMVWLVPVMDRLWVEGAEGRRRFLDRMAMSFFPAHADAALTYEKTMRERNRMLKDGITDSAWYDAVEAQMAEAGALVERNRLATLDRLEAAQGDGGSSFPAGDLLLCGAEGAEVILEGQDLKDAFRDGRRRDMAAGRTLAGPHRDDLRAVYRAKGVDARQCSTGEQKALLISLILANARAVAQDFGAPPILLLDEVSAHLDADRRAALYDEICGLGAQAWMTGTGAELFEELGDRANLLRVSEDGGVSQITDA